VTTRAKKVAGALTALATLAGATWLPSVASTNAATPPTGFALVALSPTLLATRSPGAPVRLDLGVLVTGHDQSLEIRTKRQSYGSAWISTLTVRAADGRRLRSLTLPRSTVSTTGIRLFGQVVVSSDGVPVASGPVSWCPGRNLRQRVDVEGATDAIYPNSCSIHPFSFGRLNGLERGWGSAVATTLALPASLPDGEYDVEFTVGPTMASRLRMSGEARRVRLTLTLTTLTTLATAAAPPVVTTPVPEPELHHVESIDAAILASTEITHELAAAPTVAGPAQDTLPDLSALPAYRIRAIHQDDRDVLTFAANTWNRGPAPLVVEGYRIPGTELMDANQIFYRDGAPVSSAPIGQMLFHRGVGHDHWHFTDFTRYELTNSRKRVVATSGKQSWCVAPTDAIDLNVPGALWQPETTSLASACGTVDAQWLRQVLPVGWGDTYVQTAAGQAIDITELPNGRFYIRVTVNPEQTLHERRTTNNVSYRLVILGGTPGNRTVRVPAHQGVNTG